MDSKKYQVFLSSTYKDLIEEREGIIKAILEMYHIPIGMEMFSAENEDQWEIIRRTIEVSDYYILVLGLRYGSKTSEEISFTQKEYEYALLRKIPILAFVMEDSIPLPKEKRDDNLLEINNFRKLVLSNSKMAQFWATKDQLITKVSISLMKQIMQKPGVGWIRGDRLGAEEELSKELTNLSKENRELREQILELNSRISIKNPELWLDIKTPSINKSVYSFEKLSMPPSIHQNEIENNLLDFISSEEIEKYNKNLPTEAQLERHNQEREQHYLIKNFSIPLSIDVSNIGSSKANNIFIDISFTGAFIIYKKDKEFPDPTNPIPFNPIEKAISKYNKIQQQLRLEEFVSTSNITFPTSRQFQNPDKITAISRSLDYSIKNITNNDWWTRLEGETVTIHIDSLLHTRRRTFDSEYMIAPLVNGDHKINVEIICEEYEGIKTQVIETNTQPKVDVLG